MKLIRIIQYLNEWAGRATAWITGLLVLLICYDVATRYLFRYTKIWISELEWHLFALIFLLGAGYTYLHDQHVRVDVFYSRFSPRRKAWVNLIGILFFLIPFCITILLTSVDFVEKSFLWQEGSADPGGLSHRYLIKAVLPLGFSFLLLQAIGEALNAWRIIRGKEAIVVPEDPVFEQVKPLEL